MCEYVIRKNVYLTYPDYNILSNSLNKANLMFQIS